MDTAPSRKSRWKAIGLLCLVFILGMVIGVGGGALVLRRVMRNQAAGGNIGTPRLDRAEREIISNLNLTAPEQMAVRNEFDITRREIREHRRMMFENIRGIGESTVSRIKIRLPEEKQAKFEQQARKRFRAWGISQ